MASPSLGEQIISLLNESKEDVDKLEALISQGFDVDTLMYVGGCDMTVLHLASRKGYVEYVKLLLSKGASPTFQDAFRSTSLHTAAEQSNSDVLEILAKAVLESDGSAGLRQQINKVDNYGYTPFLHAAFRCGPDVINFLLPHADLDVRDTAGQTAAIRAASSEKYDVMKLIVEHAPKEISKVTIHETRPEVYGNGEGLLHIVSYKNEGDVVKWLLERMDQKDMIAKNEEGKTAWEVACQTEYLKSSRFFDSMSAFALHEWEAGHMSDACEEMFTSSVLRGRSDGPYWCYLYGLNNIPSVLVALRKLRKSNIISQAGFSTISEELYNPREICDPVETDVVLRYREPSCRMDNIEVTRHASGLLNTSGYTSLVIPFFHVVPFNAVSFWRKYEAADPAYRSHITGPWQFCRSDNPKTYDFYPSLTLDEYSSPILPWNVLAKRNAEQVIQRVVNEQPYPGEGRLDRTIMIGQVWLWYINGTWIVSPIGRFNHSPFDSDELLGTDLGKEVSGSDYLRRIGITLLNIVKTLDHPKFPISRSQDSILDVFEKAITLVSEKVAVYIEDTSVESISTEAEKSFLHDVSDIQEELSMVRRVILQQEGIWKDFAYNAWPQYWANGQEGRMVISRQDWQGPAISDNEAREWKTILQTQTLFDKYYRRLDHLKEDSERVERSVLTQLDLKQKHATLRESHATAVMSAAVLGFTIITIIFTPLSFVTSLFALPIDQFQRNQHDSPYDDETRMYTAGYIGRWATVAEIVSTAVAGAAMWIMIDWGMGVPLTRYSWEFCKSLPRRIWSLIRHGRWKTEVFVPIEQRDFLQAKMNPGWVPPKEVKRERRTVDIKQAEKAPWKLRKFFRHRHAAGGDVEKNVAPPSRQAKEEH